MPSQPTKVVELNLYADQTITEDQRRRASFTLAQLAQRHDAVNDLPELLDMLGIAS